MEDDGNRASNHRNHEFGQAIHKAQIVLHGILTATQRLFYAARRIKRSNIAVTRSEWVDMKLFTRSLHNELHNQIWVIPHRRMTAVIND